MADGCKRPKSGWYCAEDSPIVVDFLTACGWLEGAFDGDRTVGGD